MIGLSLLLLVSGAQADREAGLEAFRAGRYEEAVARLIEANRKAPAYDALVALGISFGRLDRGKDAREAFDRAVLLEPNEPQAFVERGGLDFLERDYEAAARDLRRALGLRDDGYARGLLASSLYLGGHVEDALAEWNRLGEPRLRTVEIVGLVRTRDAVVRREIAVAEGDVLDVAALRKSRRQLAELGAFDRITLRPVPRGEGRADLDAAFLERHGLYGGLLDFVVSTAVNAISRRVFLRYTNFAGDALNFGGQYRWDEHRPELSLFLETPRPLGLPVYAQLRAFRGRQDYALGGEDDLLSRRSRGLDLILRHIVDGQTTASLDLRARDRTFSRAEAVAPPGAIVGIEAGLERRLVETRRDRLDGSGRVFRAVPGLGSDVPYTQTLVTLAYHRELALSAEPGALETSALAAQVRWGWGSRGMPLDEMFLPGGSADMDLPLRAHRQTRDGIAGESPVAPSLQLANLEWRRRLARWGELEMGSVVFLDGVRVQRAVIGPNKALVDGGFGVRLGVRGAPVIRVDFGHGFSDGKNALFVGLGQAF